MTIGFPVDFERFIWNLLIRSTSSWVLSGLHFSPVIKFSADSRYIVRAGYDKAWFVYNPAATNDSPDIVPLQKERSIDGSNPIATHPSEPVVIVKKPIKNSKKTDTLNIIDIETAQTVSSYGIDDNIKSFSFDNSGSRVLLTTTEDIIILNYDTQQGLTERIRKEMLSQRCFRVGCYSEVDFTVLNRSSRTAMWGPDGKTVIFADPSGLIYVLNATTLEVIQTVSGFTPLLVTPDKKNLLASGYYNELKCWELNSAE